MKQRVRIDALLVERGLAPSREKAQAMILAGEVLANEQKITKSGHKVAPETDLRLLGRKTRFVSRGGEKLAGALEHFAIDVEGKICLDVGSSTGGFTDCLLQNGAAKVYAVDVGTAQLVWKLRQDPRVVVHERVNARYLSEERRLVGLSTSVGLDRLLDLDKLHRGENLLRVRWLFLIAKTADEFRELSQRS